MAFDTKLNLSDNKFEQLSGETLNLSGNTYIRGGFIINSGATFTILLNHGTGKVLTSDSGGTGTWQEPITGSSGTWGSITGVLSGQTDLQACLNGKLASGGTAVCATSAINSLALCGCVPSCFLGTTACASDSAKLGGQLPAYYLNTGSTAACACDSAKLNNKLPAYYLNTGSTAVCATCAVGAKNLCGCVPASFLLSGGTAVCATSAIDSKALCGCVPSCFLGSTSCASDSAKLGNHLPSYYLPSGGTAVCALDSSKLGGVLPAGYMLSGSSSVSEFTITGNSSNTGFTITHNKNKTFVDVQIIKNTSPYPTIYTYVSRPNTNCVCVTFDTAPTTGQQYKILITS